MQFLFRIPHEEQATLVDLVKEHDAKECKKPSGDLKPAFVTFHLLLLWNTVAWTHQSEVGGRKDHTEKQLKSNRPLQLRFAEDLQTWKREHRAGPPHRSPTGPAVALGSGLLDREGTWKGTWPSAGNNPNLFAFCYWLLLFHLEGHPGSEGSIEINQYNVPCKHRMALYFSSSIS